MENAMFYSLDGREAVAVTRTGIRYYQDGQALGGIDFHSPALLDLVKSACSLWGFMRHDLSLSQMEREAAERKYQEASALILRLEEGG